MRKKPAPRQKKGVVVVGVGNPMRGDDSVGLHVARALKSEAVGDVCVLEASGAGTELIETFRDADSVIVIDAVQSGRAPGALHRFLAHDTPLSVREFSCSTHGFGVAQAIEVARALNQLPRRCVVYGVEGACFEMRSTMSHDVEQAVSACVSLVRQDLQWLQRERDGGTEPRNRSPGRGG